MTDAVKILEAAYLDMADQVKRGIRQLPTAFMPAWKFLEERHAAMVDFQDMDLNYDMYTACYGAAHEYSRTARLGIDEAFSTVICTIGVCYKSADWYSVMAKHYTHQAARRDAESETD